MKVDDGRSTDFLCLPAEEAEKTIEAMKLAEQTNDIEALKWTARRIVWLDDTSEIIGGDDNFHPAHIFSKAWAEMLKTDPPPKGIAEIISRIDQDGPAPPTAADTENALDTVKAYFEENLPHKVIAAALSSVDAMREAVKTAGAEK